MGWAEPVIQEHVKVQSADTSGQTMKVVNENYEKTQKYQLKIIHPSKQNSRLKLLGQQLVFFYSKNRGNFSFFAQLILLICFKLSYLHVPNQHYLEKYKEVCKNAHYLRYFKLRQKTYGNGFHSHFPSKICNPNFQLKREATLG